MTTDTTSANAYLRTRVMTAPPEQLRLMLLEGAIKFARQGVDGLRRKDFEASYNGLSQCRNILVELMTTMRPDVDPDLCERLRGLYTYMYNELVHGSFNKSPERVDGVIKLLEYERETWALLIQRLAEERRTGSVAPAAPALNSAPERAPISMQA